MRYRVGHVTTYSYPKGVTRCLSRAHLLPRTTPSQKVVSRTLRIDPTPDDRQDRLDGFGNTVTYFSVERPYSLLEVEAVSEVEVSSPPRSATEQESWETTRDAQNHPIAARPFTIESQMVPRTPELADFAAASFRPGRSLLDAATDLTHRIYQDFSYDPTFSTISTPIAEVMEHRRGVCQDFAHLAIGAMRSVGLAARYVSGYLETKPPPGTPKLRGADASHAWCSVRLADGTWLDLDPTNDLVAPEHHITVAWGRDYREVAPLSGIVVGPGGPSKLEVGVDVEQVVR